MILTPGILREYITWARRHCPVVPEEMALYIVKAYKSLW